jgi:multidrug transporter EmrE-like cation transporter
MAYALLVLALLLNAGANLMLKVGASQLRDSAEVSLLPRLLGTPYLLAGLLLFAINVTLYVVALSQLKLSVAYPVMAAGSLLVVVLMSGLWLGESLSFTQWSGIVLLLLGIVLVTSGSAT